MTTTTKVHPAVQTMAGCGCLSLTTQNGSLGLVDNRVQGKTPYVVLTPKMADEGQGSNLPYTLYFNEHGKACISGPFSTTGAIVEVELSRLHAVKKCCKGGCAQKENCNA